MDSRKVIRIAQEAERGARPERDMLPAAILFLSLAAMLALGWALGTCGDVEPRGEVAHAAAE